MATPTQKQPLFGILTTATPTNEPAPGWLTLEQDAHALGLRACWFRPSDVDRQRRQVHAYVCHRDGNGAHTWRRMMLPLPGVVYENLPVHIRVREDALQIKRFFRQHGIPLFNPQLGTKPQLGQWLQKYPALFKNHHPETIFTPRVQDVPALLQRHRTVYLKPFLGRGGIGIIEISREGVGTGAGANAPYRVRSSIYGTQKQAFESRLTHASLISFLQKEFARSRYLLQAGCDLLKIDRCKIDLRVHMQRNRTGAWECVGIVVKQGRADAIVSNYHLGGALHTWEWLRQRAKQQGTPLPTRQQIIDTAQKIAAAYAQKAPDLGILGFDIGLDTNGRIWLLDTNSPPSRSLLRPEQRRRAHKLTAEFAYYLLKKKGRIR